ncbi:right-handed parallel beta-helix repeat-containing protein [Modestobacter marinus]|uniref:right-handed parallel beta-helix repeat-containing protein n=1 Tax=Modestobacter marinus TaxID=477641 RepID=UPI001C95A292|nr:right-handed parallel beta-helix repeat-containing protein [Modestobacter marinus]
MKNTRAALLAVALTAGAVAAGGAVSPAAAAEAHTLTVCAAATGSCDHTTLSSALDAADPGDTVQVVGTVTVNGTTTIAEDVTVTGALGAKVVQTGSAVTFRITGAGATLTALEITSDTPKAAEFVYVGADDVTLSDNTIHGPRQALPMSGWVGNRGFVTAGGISGLTANGNTIHSLRSGAYLNPNGTGRIAGNTLHDTKGDFLIDNAAFTFTGNSAGDPEARSEWSFVVFEGTAATRYPSMAKLSAANGNMTAWDQRGVPADEVKFVAPLVAEDCKSGGWKSLDPGFRNQGQCIQFVNTGK